MKSKLDRRKQIISLLNERFRETAVARPTDNLAAASTSALPKSSEPDTLIPQLYHFYRSVIHNINSGLLAIDFDGSITFANKKATQLLGYTGKELQNMAVQHLFADGEEAARLLQLLKLPGKQISEKETRFRQKNGQVITVSMDAAPINDASNQFQGITLLFRDITELVQLREQMNRIERLALVGELAAGIAHEIRNPLGGIKTAAQVLRDSFTEEDVESQLIDRIIREVDKANKLLKEFFKFARPTPPQFAPVDIEMIIDGVYLLLAPRLKKQNIKFVENAEPHLPQVYVDETQIEQVILNLFMNAIDAMPEGGTFQVRISRRTIPMVEESLTLDKSPQLEYVLVEISDTGTGIPERILPKIFNPFFTTKKDGVGLGLSICSRLVEENHGKIDVMSELGKGTTFFIALPVFKQ